MAVKRLRAPTTKVTLNLYSESYARMAELYPDIGAQTAIRELVASHVADTDARRARAVAELAQEIDLEEPK